jgi:adenylate cyclase
MSDTPVRKLAVLLHADVVGSTALVQVNETLAHQRIQDTFKRFSKTISEYGGTTHEIRGDALVAEFARVSDAVCASLAFQLANTSHNEALADNIRPALRIGIAMGEVVIADNTVTGSGVVLAQRLEQLAEEGGTCIQGAAYETLPKRLPFDCDNLGEQQLKGFDEVVRAHAVRLQSGAEIPEPEAAVSSQVTLPDLAPEDPSELPTIAVLPFTNMSGDIEQEYFADGITEDIITELSRFRELRVMARNSTFLYKGQAVKIQDVGRELNVIYMVEGSVRKAGGRVRVTVQMVETETGGHIWAERYDRDLEDIFAVQDEITQAIVSLLPVKIYKSILEQNQRKSTANFSAYDYYLQGRWAFDNSSGNDPSAIPLIENAIEIDPTFAPAYAVLARIYGYNVFSLGIWYDDQESKARYYIEKALEYGENDPAIHTTVSEAFFCFGEFDRAITHIELALHLNPNDVATIETYGFHLSYLGDSEQGLLWLEKAKKLDPQAAGLSWETWAEVLYLHGDYQASLDVFKGRHNPPPHTYSHMAACYAQLGRMDEAQQAVDQFNSLCAEDVDFPRYAANHARICKRQQDADSWMEGYRKAGLLD